MRIPLVILTLATIILGFYPVLLEWFYNLAGSSIMTIFS